MCLGEQASLAPRSGTPYLAPYIPLSGTEWGGGVR
jgi:hypothetical protein